MATTSNAKTVRKHSTQKQKKTQNTAHNAVVQLKKKSGKSGTQKPLASVCAAIYLTKGDRKMNAVKICPLSEKKHYVLTGNEVWHKVQIIDLGEIK